VPRLSIIVPHLHDDAAFEHTMLSVLVHREHETEVLIAHDGSYSDPYGLAQDEAVLIQSPSGESLSSLINLAVASACSPYIQVLLPGASVQAGWNNEALDLLQDRYLDAVCVPIRCQASNELVVGLLGASLPHRRIASNADSVAGPLMLGSILRKKFLHSVGGWLAGCNREIAEVEMGLLIDTLGVEFGIAKEATIQANKRLATGQESGYEIGHACGQLACAYSAIEDSGMAVSSLTQRLGHLASGLMSPKTVAERLGWVMGIRNRALVDVVLARVAAADAALFSSPNTLALPQSQDRDSHRRAA
jgi:hypothetical protein